MLLRKKKLFFIILFYITLLFLAGCIVRPEYLAESSNIPQRAEYETVMLTTPPPTVEPVYTPEPTASLTVEKKEKDADKDIDQKNTESSYAGYSYSLLTDSQKEIYSQFNNHLSVFEPSFTIYCEHMEDLKPAYNALVKDYPEYYYLRGYNRSYFEGSAEIEISMYYADETIIEQVKSDLAEIDSIVNNEVFAQMDEGLSDYEQVVYFYTWLGEHVKYESGKNDQSIIGVFLENKAVCNGYAESFQYLCNKAGIECTTASGYGTNESHAWNLIKLNDQYYWVDVTWGDQTDGDIDELHGQYIDYAFLCMDDELLFQSHSLAEGESYPACTDRTLNYYYRNGGFFEQYNKNEMLAFLYERFGSTTEAKVQMMFEYHEDFLKMLDEGSDLIKEVLQSNPNYQQGYTIYSWYSDAGNFILYVIDG